MSLGVGVPNSESNAWWSGGRADVMIIKYDKSNACE